MCERASGEIELEREEGAPRWSILKPLQARANDDIAYSIVEEISELEAESIVDETPAAAENGAIDENTAMFVLQPQKGDPIELVSFGSRRLPRRARIG